MDAARKLMLLAADIEPEADPILWDILREGTERRWGVTRDVGKTLSEALLEIAAQLGGEHWSDAESVELVREHGGPRNAGAKLYLATEVAKTVTGKERGASTPDAILEELRRRLTPEGCEWPRYEDGEPVQIGDYFQDDEGNWGRAYYVTFDSANPVIVGVNTDAGDYEFHVSDGERVRRPARLAADGVPISEGETVFMRGNGRRGVVRGFDGDWALVEYDAHDVNGATMTVRTDGACLTHTKPEPPDSWERIEKDARLKPTEYTDRYRVGRFGFESEDMRVDLVLRCKALAERERGEK